MNAFDNHKKKHMPQTDQDKDSLTLLTELKNFIINPTYLAKVNELLGREIKNGDADDVIVSGTPIDRGGIRPKHAPIVP